MIEQQLGAPVEGSDWDDRLHEIQTPEPPGEFHPIIMRAREGRCHGDRIVVSRQLRLETPG
jgi:hypothetical protein